MKKVLFVCRGNTCRSILAESIFQKMIGTNKLNRTLKVASAGTHVEKIRARPHENTVKIAAENKIDVSSHYAKSINPDDLSTYDYVIGMDNKNISDIQALFHTRSYVNLYLLLDFSLQHKGMEICDPHNLNTNAYRHAYNLILMGSIGLFKTIKPFRDLS